MVKGTRFSDQEFMYRLMHPETEPLPPGSYGRVIRDGNWTWMCTTPNGLLGDLANHSVTEYEDETITVRPSILVDAGAEGSWHGFLERGVWKEAT